MNPLVATLLHKPTHVALTGYYVFARQLFTDMVKELPGAVVQRAVGAEKLVLPNGSMLRIVAPQEMRGFRFDTIAFCAQTPTPSERSAVAPYLVKGGMVISL